MDVIANMDALTPCFSYFPVKNRSKVNVLTNLNDQCAFKRVKIVLKFKESDIVGYIGSNCFCFCPESKIKINVFPNLYG